MLPWKGQVGIVIFAFGMVKVSRNNRQQEDTNFLNGLNRWSIWYCVLNLRPLSSGASNFDEPRNRSTSTRLHLVHRRRHQETYEHRTSQRFLVSRHSIFQVTSFQQQFLMHPKEILSPEHCFRVCHSTSSCNISSFRIGWHFRDMKIQKRVWVLLMK